MLFPIIHTRLLSKDKDLSLVSASELQISHLARMTTLDLPQNKQGHGRAARTSQTTEGKSIGNCRTEGTLSTREEVKPPHLKATSERKVR